MLFYLILACALSIVVPAIAGLTRLRSVRPAYYPFIIILWACFVNEFISAILVFTKGNNVPLYNIFGLLYPLLILWQFYIWRPGKLLLSSSLLLAAGWLACFWKQGNLNHYFYPFLMLRSLLIAAWCVGFIYSRMQLMTHSLHQDSIFLICSGWAFSFIDSFATVLLVQYGERTGYANSYQLVVLFSLANFIVVFIHLYAVLCLPPGTRSFSSRL